VTKFNDDPSPFSTEPAPVSESVSDGELNSPVDADQAIDLDPMTRSDLLDSDPPAGLDRTGVDPATGSGSATSESESTQEPEASPAVVRFKSCRWHESPDSGASYCSNRDVLPFAGRISFNPEAWCPDCKFYKVKRKVKKRPTNYDDYGQ
jgi:hypothetical protein